ncbi:MAG: hypothetical protein NXI10_10420 [bacterium]|nr:hypothetical protein [bacterium]
MNLKITFCFLFALTFINGCQLGIDNKNDKKVVKQYCGYELSMEEWNEIQSESFNINPYMTENSSEILLEIYDTVKHNVDSSVTYELTLAKLKADEVWLDLKVAKSDQSVDEIGCLIMNSEFSQKVPKQRKVRIFEKDFNDPTGRNQNIIVGIKRIE